VNKQEYKEYLSRLKLELESLHHCGAYWIKSKKVHELFHGEIEWKVSVEVFALIGHGKAKHVYAWIQREDKGGDSERIVAVLETPTVDSAERAVEASILRVSKTPQS
jgi:hypothetical protein